MFTIIYNYIITDFLYSTTLTFSSLDFFNILYFHICIYELWFYYVIGRIWIENILRLVWQTQWILCHKEICFWNPLVGLWACHIWPLLLGLYHGLYMLLFWDFPQPWIPLYKSCPQHLAIRGYNRFSLLEPVLQRTPHWLHALGLFCYQILRFNNLLDQTSTVFCTLPRKSCFLWTKSVLGETSLFCVSQVPGLTHAPRAVSRDLLIHTQPSIAIASAFVSSHNHRQTTFPKKRAQP